MNETSPQLRKFEHFEQQPSHPAWLLPVRKAGLARFAELGFPTLQEEDWRFTNVAPLARLPFEPVFSASAEGLTREALAKFPLSSLPVRLVFVDGHYAPELSSPAAEKGGILVGNLAWALEKHPALVEKYFTAQPQEGSNSFAALNTAFFQDGGFVYVPAGRVLEQPVHLMFISTAREAGATAHPRNLLVVEKGGQATVFESYVSTGGAAYFTNALTELVLEEGAILEHGKVQDESVQAFHVAAIQARLARASNLISHSLALGARLSRNSIRTALAGEGVECVLNGLYVTGGEQLADHHMVVEHAQPHCQSHEYFNGILDGHSKGVFHGRILVRQAAQKTDAKQTNKNLLLSEDATVDTKPQLEIYADDVKCTHGATIGQLNEEAIFYLRARGIGTATARRMLIQAFAAEIIERIRNTPVRDELEQLVWGRLETNPHVSAIPEQSATNDHPGRRGTTHV
jgi:Fe-S cluster assembly protein SufD